MKDILEKYKNLGVKTLSVKDNEATAVNPYEKYGQGQRFQNGKLNYTKIIEPQWQLFSDISLPPLPTSGIPDGQVGIEEVEEVVQWRHERYLPKWADYIGSPEDIDKLRLGSETRIILRYKAERLKEQAKFPEGLDFETPPTKEEAEAGYLKRRAIQAENLRLKEQGEETIVPTNCMRERCLIHPCDGKCKSAPVEPQPEKKECAKCQELKRHKINLMAEVEALRQRLVDAGLEKPAVQIDYQKNA